MTGSPPTAPLPPLPCAAPQYYLSDKDPEKGEEPEPKPGGNLVVSNLKGEYARGLMTTFATIKLPTAQVALPGERGRERGRSWQTGCHVLAPRNLRAPGPCDNSLCAKELIA